MFMANKRWGSYLMKQLAIPLSNQKTIAKWLVITASLRFSGFLIYLMARSYTLLATI
jgi:hypothetical protein